MRKWHACYTTIRLAAQMAAGVAVGFLMWPAGDAHAESGGYPYAAKPCIWAPYAASGAKANWCPDYDFGDRRDDESAANVISPYGYYYRNCTDYAAWRLAQRGTPAALYKGLGNAKNWGVAAAARGLRVDDRPAAGAVAVRTSGAYGHLAFIEAVEPNGRIRVSQYNWGADGNYSVRTDTPAAMGFQLFIHFQDNLPAGLTAPLPALVSPPPPVVIPAAAPPAAEGAAAAGTVSSSAAAMVPTAAPAPPTDIPAPHPAAGGPAPAATGPPPPQSALQSAPGTAAALQTDAAPAAIEPTSPASEPVSLAATPLAADQAGAGTAAVPNPAAGQPANPQDRPPVIAAGHAYPAPTPAAGEPPSAPDAAVPDETAAAVLADSGNLTELAPAGHDAPPLPPPPARTAIPSPQPILGRAPTAAAAPAAGLAAAESARLAATTASSATALHWLLAMAAGVLAAAGWHSLRRRQTPAKPPP